MSYELVSIYEFELQVVFTLQVTYICEFRVTS